jgi:hypothetical protein
MCYTFTAMEAYHNTAIVFGSLKEALLHFEYVIPLNFVGRMMGLRPAGDESGELIEQFKDAGMDDYREMQEAFEEPDPFRDLYPPALAKDRVFKVAANIFDGLLFSYMIKVSYGDKVFGSYVKTLAEVTNVKKPLDPKTFSPTREGLQRSFTSLVTEFQLQNIPVDCSHFFMGSGTDVSPDDSLSVPQVCVVDTSKLTFPQIMEFRKDKDTMNKMRKFRLFAYEQYSGKDRAYIEDDIQQRLTDYDAAVKSCGFETTYKTLSFLFESKVLIGAFATAAVSLLMGNAQVAREAFAAGAMIEVGKLSLEYARRRHELKKICAENPISYIADVKQISR